MLKHNFLLFFRNVKKYKTTFLIKIISLSTGLASVFLIALWILDEISVDAFHENDSRLFQVMLTFEDDSGIDTTVWTPAPLGKALAEEIPEIEQTVTTFTLQNNGIIKGDDDISIRARQIFASKDFFSLFSFQLIEGNKNMVLADDNSVVISDEMAQRIFATSDNIVGRTLQLKQSALSGVYTISGVFQKVPKNSTLQFDVVFPFGQFLKKMPEFNSWTYNDPNTYVLLKEGASVPDLNEKITNLLKGKPKVEIASSFLHQYSKNYLYGTFENGVQSGGRITYIRLFLIIAVFVLLIASINITNLSTAQASRRVKEIGIKKSVGAHRKSLIFQYFGESFLMNFASLLVAMFMVLMILPWFNLAIGKHITLDFDIRLISILIGITTCTAIISGIHPALYLSGFNPLLLLKGTIRTNTVDWWFRMGLVIFQFSISIALIVSVIVVAEQINFVKNKNLGYNRDHVIIFKNDGKIAGDLGTFLLEVKNVPGVLDATSADHELLRNGTSTTGLTWEGMDPNDRITFKYINANYDFIEVLNIGIKEGRSFSRDFKTETQKIILNETAIKSMGLVHPVGKTIKVWGEDREIIGIVKDFNFQSLYEKVTPLFFNLSDVGYDIMIRLQSGTQRETIARVRDFYKDFNEGLDMDYRFLDSDYQAFYESENRVATLSGYFAGLAILLSCLGLFGLAAFAVERRRKEISIRKVLGQTAAQITAMLSSEFVNLVLISSLISLPIAYVLAYDWLSGFAYHVPLRFWYFSGAGLIALLVALLTVGSQALGAANQNPVDGLREE